MKGILIKANDTIQSSIGSQNAIISAVNKLMDSYQNYLLISEQEQTKRATSIHGVIYVLKRFVVKKSY